MRVISGRCRGRKLIEIQGRRIRPTSDRVKEAIFNILGQKVSTLLENQYLPAGSHLYFWNAKSDAGSDVSTGIYFYRLETEQEIHTKKMVFLK